MKKTKNYLRSLLLIVVCSLYSCESIDVTDISCRKVYMSSSTTIPVNELIRSPEILNIDNKDIKIKISYLINNTSYVKPRINPPLVNNCNKSSIGGIIYKKELEGYIHSFNFPLPLDRDLFKPEKVWFINDEKNIAETSNIEFKIKPIDEFSGFGVTDKIQSLNNDTISILKFNYKGKTYYIRSKLDIMTIV